MNKNPNAVALGRLGGSKKSPEKTEAARANIRKRWDKVRSQTGVSPIKTVDNQLDQTQ